MRKESLRNRAWSKRVYVLPNLFTTANMFCGFLAIILAIDGKFEHAAWAIIVAGLFDSMDGRVARMARATSDFGVQYDSLSDLISFGLAPAFVAYLWAFRPFGRLGWLVAFLYVVCAALRLARFNVMIGVVPKGYFQGLPSPMAAGTLATGILFYHELGLKWPVHVFMLPVLLSTATLMISTIAFPSFKEFKISRENSFGILAVFVLTLTLIAVKPEITIFLMGLTYISLSVLVGMIVAVLKAVKGRSQKKTPSPVRFSE